MAELATDRGFGSVDDVDFEPKFSYRDEARTWYRVEGTPAIRFDSVPDFRSGASEDMPPGEGHGVLDVFLCSNGTASATGVLLLDGEPVAAGDGRYQISLPPGVYKLEVQGEDASTVECSITTGERTLFTSAHGVMVRHLPGFHTRLYQVGDTADFLPAVNRDAARSASFGCLATVAGLIAVMVAAVWAALTDSETAEVVAAVAVVLAAVGLMTGVAMGVRTAQRVQREVEASRIGVERHSGERPRCLTGDPVGFSSPYYLRDLGAGSSGAAIVFDLFLYRVTRRADGAVVYTGDAESLALAHAGSVRLWVDDVEVGCDWATWFYPLAEGGHHFRVEYGPDDRGEVARHEFALEVDGMSIVHVPVRVFRIWNERERALESLRPQIAQRVTEVDLLDRRHVDWIPSRIWPKVPTGQA